jgi:MoaA/NifB/PqqE/SkfB family radical SAM enzyme
MERRIDHLGRLGTSVITISGGEPLLHPELDRVMRGSARRARLPA